MATLGRNLTPAQRETIETTGTIVARDNVELACAFIQKKAVEKALPEIDKRLKVTPVLATDQRCNRLCKMDSAVLSC